MHYPDAWRPEWYARSREQREREAPEREDAAAKGRGHTAAKSAALTAAPAVKKRSADDALAATGLTAADNAFASDTASGPAVAPIASVPYAAGLVAKGVSQTRLVFELADYAVYAAHAAEVRARHAARGEATLDPKRTRRDEDGDANGRLAQRAGSHTPGQTRRTVWRTHGWPYPMPDEATPPPPAATTATAAAAHDGGAAAAAGASAACGVSSTPQPPLPPSPPPPSPPPSPGGSQDAGAQSPPPPSSSSSSSPPMAPGEYERRRDEQKLRNQAKLVELGFDPLPSQQPGSKTAGKKRTRPEAAASVPSRPSLARPAKSSHLMYKLPNSSDDEEEDEEEEEEEEEEYEEEEDASGSEDDDFRPWDSDWVDSRGGAAAAASGSSSSGAGGRGCSKKKKPKTTPLQGKSKGKAAASGAGAKGKSAAGGGGGAGAPKPKQIRSRGVHANAAPGGRGFECPRGSGAFHDTADDAISHGNKHFGVIGNGRGGRVIDDAGKTPCLWDSCGKLFAARGASGNLRMLLIHEATHVKGDAADFTGFECPEAGCVFRDPTSAAVWTHAAEVHGIEEDGRRCLWARCGRHFQRPMQYRAHEGVHTGVFPFTCLACGLGYGQDSHARACCVVGAACRCGTVYKGHHAKRNFATHQKKCQLGAAPLPSSTAAGHAD